MEISFEIDIKFSKVIKLRTIFGIVKIVSNQNQIFIKQYTEDIYHIILDISHHRHIAVHF